jgi:hypothetical protein
MSQGTDSSPSRAAAAAGDGGGGSSGRRGRVLSVDDAVERLEVSAGREGRVFGTARLGS